MLITLFVLAAPLFHLPGSIWAGTLWRKNTVIGLLTAATLSYLAAVALVLCAALPRWSMGWIIGVALVARLGLLAFPPFMSSDVFRYAWDGRVQAHGINPYRYVPTDPALAQLRDAAIFPNINRLDYAHTIYPPAAQLVFLAAGEAGYSITASKLALLLLEAAGMAALWRVLVLAGLPPARLLIYAWNPLAIWSAAADGHVDAAAVGFVGLALLASVVGRQGLTGALLGAAILTKFLPLVVAPALWRRWGWRLPAVCAAVMVALYACYIGAGWQVLGFLPAYTSGGDGAGVGLLAAVRAGERSPLAARGQPRLCRRLCAGSGRGRAVDGVPAARAVRLGGGCPRLLQRRPASRRHDGGDGAALPMVLHLAGAAGLRGALAQHCVPLLRRAGPLLRSLPRDAAVPLAAVRTRDGRCGG